MQGSALIGGIGAGSGPARADAGARSVLTAYRRGWLAALAGYGLLAALVVALAVTVGLTTRAVRTTAGLELLGRVQAAAADCVSAIAEPGDRRPSQPAAPTAPAPTAPAPTAPAPTAGDGGPDPFGTVPGPATVASVERAGRELRARVAELAGSGVVDPAAAERVRVLAEELAAATVTEARARVDGDLGAAARTNRSRTVPTFREIGAELRAELRRLQAGAERARLVALLQAGILVPLLAGVIVLTGLRLRRLDAVTADRSRFEAVVDAMEDVVLLTAADGTVGYASPSSRWVWGRPPDHLADRPLTELVLAEDGPAVTEVLRRVAGEPERVHRTEARAAHVSGDVRVLDLTVHRLDTGTLVWTVRDVTGGRRAIDRLERLGLTDPLTRLPSRALLLDRTGQALARAGAGGGSGRPAVALLLVGLDRLVDVNTGLGHAAGDRLLVEVAATLQEAAGPGTTVARVSGDVFGILLEWPGTGAGIDRSARAVADRVTALLGDRVPVSIGLVTAGEEATAASLLLAASVALQVSQSQGPRRVTAFRPAMLSRAQERVSMAAGLADAIPRGELRMRYQPLVRLENGALEGFEALVRWQHPTLGLLGPDQFIPLAEELGVIEDLGRWVLDAACAQSAAWARAGGSGAPPVIGVNVSARQLLADGFVDDVLAALDRHGRPPEALVVELTETALVDDLSQAAAALLELRDAGVRAVLDDFGSGYSALGYLTRLPLVAVKIDRSFLGGRDPERLLSGVHDLVQRLGLTLVAEGIETPAQDELVRRSGIRVGQGFLYGAPLDAAGIEAPLAGSRTGRSDPARS